MKRQSMLVFAGALLITAVACSLAGQGSPSSTPQEPATQAAEPNTVSEGAATGGVSSLDLVQAATVQIEAQGTFVDPEVGVIANSAGRGSGFIIDPTGIAVTNNHVVTGAGLLRVWVGGDPDPQNAKVLGVSECSDLAVIDIDGGDFSYLQWSQQEAGVGEEVYAAGFPLGDPEFTLTKGIISKADADGETGWASVDGVLQHDATINPGNSGGPLVGPEGQVIGVNYSFRPEADQYFAIKGSAAMPIIEELRQGRDVNALGINGSAVADETGELTGIWVASVASGSPADEAGLQPGDVVTMLEGVILAEDGTMSSYCDILRSHRASDVLSVEVLRFNTGEVLTGQLNGRPLEQSFSFGSSDTGPAGDSLQEGTTYREYILVTDDTGAIQMEVPSSWSDVDGSIWNFMDAVPYASIWAAPNLEEFATTWAVPGVKFNVSDDIAELGGYVQQLDLFASDYRELCAYDGRYDYEDPLYRGKYDWFYNCGGPGGADYLMLSAVSIESPTDYLILVEVQITTEADLDALDRILDTFQVVGFLP